jgi:hypothetical protein
LVFISASISLLASVFTQLVFNTPQLVISPAHTPSFIPLL